MEKLNPGKTIIGTCSMDDKNTGKSVDVEVLYRNEDEGYLVTKDGDIKRVHGDEYRNILKAYKTTQWKADNVSRLMDEETEAASDHISYEEQDEITPESDNQQKTATDINDDQCADRKKQKIPLIILVSVLALLAILLLISFVYPGKNKQSTTSDQGNSSVGVAVLKRTVPVGELVSSSDFEVSYVSRDTFDVLSRTTYIGANGKSHEGTVILWNDIPSYDNYVALRTIEEGSVAYADDFALSRSAITGQMTIRLVAVIGSESIDDGEIVCELGRYVVEAGSLTDILNSQGQSILGDLYDEAETEETAENIEIAVEAVGGIETQEEPVDEEPEADTELKQEDNSKDTEQPVAEETIE